MQQRAAVDCFEIRHKLAGCRYLQELLPGESLAATHIAAEIRAVLWRLEDIARGRHEDVYQMEFKQSRVTSNFRYIIPEPTKFNL